MFKSKILGVFAVLTLSLLAITASEVQGATSRVINLSTVQVGDSYGNPVQWEAVGGAGGVIRVTVHSGANVEVIGSSANVDMEAHPNSNTTLNGASFFQLETGGNLTLTLLGNNTVSNALGFQGNTTINGGGSLSTNQIAGMHPATLNLVSGHITADMITAQNLTLNITGGSLVVGGNPYGGGMASASATVGGNFTYNGTAHTPTPTVTMAGLPLVANTHFTYIHSNNINPGTATVTITGMGNFVGSTTANFTITSPQTNQPTPPQPPQPPVTQPPAQPEEEPQEPDWWMTLTPNQIIFDRTNPQDITVTIGADGPSARNVRQQRIEQVFQGVRTLVEGEDWSIEGNEVTIYAEFLLTLREGRRFINIGDGQIRVDIIETEEVLPTSRRSTLWSRFLPWLE